MISPSRYDAVPALDWVLDILSVQRVHLFMSISLFLASGRPKSSPYQCDFHSKYVQCNGRSWPHALMSSRYAHDVVVQLEFGGAVADGNGSILHLASFLSLHHTCIRHWQPFNYAMHFGCSFSRQTHKLDGSWRIRRPSGRKLSDHVWKLHNPIHRHYEQRTNLLTMNIVDQSRSASSPLSTSDAQQVSQSIDSTFPELGTGLPACFFPPTELAPPRPSYCNTNFLPSISAVGLVV